MSGFPYARGWKILLLGPAPSLGGGLKSLLTQEIPALQVFEVKSYPDAAALPSLISSQGLSICLFDVSTKPETALPLIREMQRLSPRLPIIAVLQDDETDLILSCLRQGAADFIALPAAAAQLDQVFTKVVQSYPELAPANASARVISVISAKGGCGASTLALNLAFQRKRLGVKRILLADLDPLTGTLAFQLRAKPAYSFLDAMNRGSQLDQDIWKGLVHTMDGIDILFSPEAVSEALYMLGDPAAMIQFARGCYDILILDVASAHGAWNGRLAQLSDEILLVATGDPLGLRSAQRSLASLRNHQIPAAKTRIVVNRYSKTAGLGTDVLETSLQKGLFMTLPSDPESIQRSVIEAKPVVAGSAFAKGVLALADALAGPKQAVPEKKPAPKSGALSGLLAMFGKKATS